MRVQAMESAVRKKKQILLSEEELRQQRARAQAPEKPSLLQRMLQGVRRSSGAQALEQDPGCSPGGGTLSLHVLPALCCCKACCTAAGAGPAADPGCSQGGGTLSLHVLPALRCCNAFGSAAGRRC